MSFVEEMNGNDITAVVEFCIMDCKPIITCKYTNFMSYVYFMSYGRTRGYVQK